MNRRDVLRAAVGGGLMAIMPVAARATEATPAASPGAGFGADDLRSLRSAMPGVAIATSAATATYGGPLPAGLSTMTAIATIARDDDAAEALPVAIAQALHDRAAKLAPRGTLTADMQLYAVPTPGGADVARGYVTVTGTTTIVTTAVRAGRWGQVLTGPTTMSPQDAADALIAVAAATMTHWGDVGGGDDPATALPVMGDLPNGATVIVPPTVVRAPFGD